MVAGAPFDDTAAADAGAVYLFTVCGDGVVDPGEACDDGNRVTDDGCDAHCRFECGTGRPDAGEDCDDGNRVDGDGCPADCRRETRNHLACYRVRPARGARAPARRRVVLQDDFGRRKTAILRPVAVCNPTDREGEGIPDPFGHLTCYRIRDRRAAQAQDRQLQNALGEEVVRVGPASTMCVASVQDGRVPLSLGRRLEDPRPEGQGSFGATVAAKGSDILVGAPSFTEGYTLDTGIAYLFDRRTGALRHTFANPTPDFRDAFGAGVAFFGGDVAIGMNGPNCCGEVFLFDRRTSELRQTFKPTDIGTERLEVLGLESLCVPSTLRAASVR